MEWNLSKQHEDSYWPNQIPVSGEESLEMN